MEHVSSEICGTLYLLLGLVVQISNITISNMPIFLVEKNVRSICNAKVSRIFFSTKNISVFGYKVVKHLMS